MAIVTGEKSKFQQMCNNLHDAIPLELNENVTNYAKLKENLVLKKILHKEI